MKLKILLAILLFVQQVVFAQTYIVSQTGTIRNVRDNIQQNKGKRVGNTLVHLQKI